MGFSLKKVVKKAAKVVKKVANVATLGQADKIVDVLTLGQADKIKDLVNPNIKDPNKAAQEAEAERQALIDRNSARINSVFDDPSRQRGISDFLSGARKYYLDDLNEQKSEQDRQATFALARSGLSGGSRDVDLRRDLGKSYLKGVLTADRRAQAAAEDLRSSDQDLRRSLLSMASTGANVGNVGQQALTSMSGNIAAKRADLAQSGLGNLFEDFADIYSRSRDAADRRRAEREGLTLYGSTY